LSIELLPAVFIITEHRMPQEQINCWLYWKPSSSNLTDFKRLKINFY